MSINRIFFWLSVMPRCRHIYSTCGPIESLAIGSHANRNKEENNISTSGPNPRGEYLKNILYGDIPPSSRGRNRHRFINFRHATTCITFTTFITFSGQIMTEFVE